ncbi:uncharacterized protein LOC124930391 [Impatiens glandulifera]|uniref:uncharacterized protein LOC124930391 n=1 Tax=Impatiens glandulifera TaxID=253017 RepID=UPI001FB08AD6|nr:uncharacterized protein LOC124930391 [Impatiens glandulifera]
MAPRISFSADFINVPIKNEGGYREPPVSSDFEFSVSGYSMISADEVFCKGKLMPLKEESCSKMSTSTLRDELLVNDDDDEQNQDVLPKIIPRRNGVGGWRERLLGLKRGGFSPKRDHENRA